ncbi:PKD domain-containing protein [Microbacterium lacus]|uniref:PKD domain-containing protein n=1 Tax=Microbacterium lacus TaxID=415217 RepID=UPI000C2BFAE1|nr:PKD domain-containing protein [Microbacterium lacus]
MSIIRKWSGDGLSAGALTTGSVGTGDAAWSSVVAGHTIEAAGTRSPRIAVPDDAVAYYTRWLALGNLSTWAARYAFRWASGAPGGSIGLIEARDSAGNQVFRIEINTSGLVRIRNASAATWSQTTGGLVAAQDYRVEVYGGSGTLNLRIYQGDSTTPYISQSSAVETATVDEIRFGRHSGQTLTGERRDDFAVSDTAALIGPPIPPSVDAGPAQNVAAAATVNLTATAGGGGSISSYAWTFVYPTSGAPTLTGASTSSASFTAGAAGNLYILQCVVTDSEGATATDTVEVRVPVAGGTAIAPLPVNGSGSSGWTIGGGSSTEGAALADSNDATYVASPTVTGVETARRWRLSPSAAKTSGQVAVRLSTDSGTANVTVRLVEGSTVRQTWTQAITSVVTEYTFNLSSPAMAAIGDWANLYVEVGATS